MKPPQRIELQGCNSPLGFWYCNLLAFILIPSNITTLYVPLINEIFFRLRNETNPSPAAFDRKQSARLEMGTSPTQLQHKAQIMGKHYLYLFLVFTIKIFQQLNEILKPITKYSNIGATSQFGSTKTDWRGLKTLNASPSKMRFGRLNFFSFFFFWENKAANFIKNWHPSWLRLQHWGMKKLLPSTQINL